MDNTYKPKLIIQCIKQSMKVLEKLNCSNLDTLGFAYNNISKIEGIEKFEKITNLSLNSNKITDVLPLADIASINKLTALGLTGNLGINENRNEYTEAEIVKLDKIGAILDRGRKD